MARTYQDKKTAPDLDPVVDYDYELIYMIILVTVGIITTIAGFIIHRKRYNGGMRDMRK